MTGSIVPGWTHNPTSRRLVVTADSPAEALRGVLEEIEVEYAITFTVGPIDDFYEVEITYA